MSFDIELVKLQTACLLSEVVSSEALELQALLDKDDREGYAKRIIALSKESSGSHDFTIQNGKVYELKDTGKTIKVPIKFQVKNSVITWAFTAPRDLTTQAFRDLVFNTAAKAHACVDNSCETYYRGTNHLHIRLMHTCKEEADFNHNHFRTGDDGPITPVEVYQHLFAFYAQAEGKQFISSRKERDDIILKFTVYWAEFNADIKYVAFFLMDGEGSYDKIEQSLIDIARMGALTPEQAEAQLDTFFSSDHGKTLVSLAEGRGFPVSGIEPVKQFIKAKYRKAYQESHPAIQSVVGADRTLEPVKEDAGTESSKSSRRLSPRDDYMSLPEQTLDPIDILELETFASDITKHCRSIDKKLLQHLELEDFRKGLLLYYALRTAQQNSSLLAESGSARFHSDLTTLTRIKEMIAELPNLLEGSTESSLGGVLLGKLVAWVRTAPPDLETWVELVKINGASAFGAKIRDVREPSGKIDLRKADLIPSPPEKGKYPDIRFTVEGLKKVFEPNSSEEISSTSLTEKGVEVLRLKKKLSSELKQLVEQQRGINKLGESNFQAKVKVIDAGLSFLSGNSSMMDLQGVMSANIGWNSVSMGKLKSSLEQIILDIVDIDEQEINHGNSVNFGISG